jgi:hypothetical protein
MPITDASNTQSSHIARRAELNVLESFVIFAMSIHLMKHA